MCNWRLRFRFREAVELERAHPDVCCNRAATHVNISAVCPCCHLRPRAWGNMAAHSGAPSMAAAMHPHWRLAQVLTTLGRAKEALHHARSAMKLLKVGSTNERSQRY